MRLRGITRWMVSNRIHFWSSKMRQNAWREHARRPACWYLPSSYSRSPNGKCPCGRICFRNLWRIEVSYLQVRSQISPSGNREGFQWLLHWDNISKSCRLCHFCKSMSFYQGWCPQHPDCRVPMREDRHRRQFWTLPNAWHCYLVKYPICIRRWVEIRYSLARLRFGNFMSCPNISWYFLMAYV